MVHTMVAILQVAPSLSGPKQRWVVQCLCCSCVGDWSCVVHQYEAVQEKKSWFEQFAQ